MTVYTFDLTELSAVADEIKTIVLRSLVAEALMDATIADDWKVA